MVKIRLKRQGNRHRPFYRVVVSKANQGRDAAFIENIGYYNPLDKATGTSIKDDRALYWLLNGAVPTETVAYLLNKTGVMEQFFAQRPAARRKFSSLNKAIPVTSAPTAVEAAPAAEEA